MRLGLIIISIFLSSWTVFGQAAIVHQHISGKKGFTEKQNINILSIPLLELKTEYSLVLAWSDSTLLKTSQFAERYNAIAAINAGFFNVKEGGSVTYLETGNEMVSRRSWKGDPRDSNSTNLNGALILNRDNEIVIEKAQDSRTYLNSNREKWVLVTGPVLLKNGKALELINNSFVNDKHPRTCVGLSRENLFLITIDGRNPKASGMTLNQVQNFLIALGCIDAINLDGGGSTTMWLDNGSAKEVVNCPSDNKKFDNLGERKVANALVLLSN